MESLCNTGVLGVAYIGGGAARTLAAVLRVAGEGRASSGLHCAVREASMEEADRRSSARQLWH